MNYILFDSDVRDTLLPFTYTKPVADIRIGILTIREKWEKRLGLTTTTITADYLEEKYPMVEMEENILINASFCPTESLVEKVKNLSKNEAIFKGEDVLAFHTTQSQEEVDFDTYTQIEFDEELIQIKNIGDPDLRERLQAAAKAQSEKINANESKMDGKPEGSSL